MSDFQIPHSELELFTKVFMSADMYIMFETTYYCENNCPHCHTNCSTRHDLTKHIPESIINYYIEELTKFPQNNKSIDFAGGEISHIESISPGYISRILNKSLSHNIPTTLLTNGTWINNPEINNRLLNTLRQVFITYSPNFQLQISFDSYHKNCITNTHQILWALSNKLPKTKKPTFPINLMGFKHEPHFQDYVSTNQYTNLKTQFKPEWDLNCVGRAKINNLAHCRDTAAEFEALCNGDKSKELFLTPLYPNPDNTFGIMIIFNSTGNAILMDAHNPANFHKFKTPFTENATPKPLQQIKTELAMQLIDHFYGHKK